MLLAGHLGKRNRPSCEDGQHDNDSNQMRKIPKGPHFAGAPQHRQHDGVEEKKMQRPFRQPAESEKNPGHKPGEPG